MSDPTTATATSTATGVHQHQRSGEWFVLRQHGSGAGARIVGAVPVTDDEDQAHLVAHGAVAYYDGWAMNFDPTEDAAWAEAQPWGPPVPPAA